MIQLSVLLAGSQKGVYVYITAILLLFYCYSTALSNGSEYAENCILSGITDRAQGLYIYESYILRLNLLLVLLCIVNTKVLATTTKVDR